MLAALEAGAEDIRTEGDTYEIITAPEDFAAVRDGIAAGGIKYTTAELTRLPKSTITVNDKEARQVLRMVDQLEDSDDVQQVYANFDIPEDILEAIAGE
jgi:transcriptional/translational regulatory protein YebC/TACO1